MSAHKCLRATVGCYRCDLNQDEIEAFKAEDRLDAHLVLADFILAGKGEGISRIDMFIAGFMAGREG